MDQRPICTSRRTNNDHTPHPSGNAPRRITAPLTRARLMRGVAKSHDHRSPEFSVLGQGIQGACLRGNSPKGNNMTLNRVGTLNATPTSPLDLAGKCKGLLTSMAITPSCACAGPHPPQDCSNPLSQVRNQVNGRLRKGLFVSRGVAKKNKSSLVSGVYVCTCVMIMLLIIEIMVRTCRQESLSEWKS